MKILIICTGNSCRSQMAEGFLKSYNNKIEVFSAGVDPAITISKYAVAVMKELGIDIGKQYPKDVNEFLKDEFDYVITVCDNAKQQCPIFKGKVGTRLHIGFEDPADAVGTDIEKLNFYRRIRDEINIEFTKFYKEKIESVI